MAVPGESGRESGQLFAFQNFVDDHFARLVDVDDFMDALESGERDIDYVGAWIEREFDR